MQGRDPAASPQHVPSAAELQRAIASVTGVAAAEVTRAENGRDRLRISLTPGEDPEAVAWSVAATLRERFGIALDPAAITARVTTAGEEETARTIAPGPGTGPYGDAPHAGGTSPEAGGTSPEAGAASSAGDVADRPPTADGAADRDTSDAGTTAPEPVLTAAGPVPAPDDGRSAAEDLVAATRAAIEATAPAGPGSPSRRHRAAIRELIAHADGDDLDVSATLAVPGREVIGRARGLRTRRGRWRAIAEATLDALDGLAVGRVRGHVDHVTVLTFADLAHVSVSVTLLTERGEETYLGAALVRDDPDRAVMRAALDAVNRRVEPWIAEGSIQAS